MYDRLLELCLCFGLLIMGHVAWGIPLVLMLQRR